MRTACLVERPTGQAARDLPEGPSRHVAVSALWKVFTKNGRHLGRTVRHVKWPRCVATRYAFSRVVSCPRTTYSPRCPACNTSNPPRKPRDWVSVASVDAADANEAQRPADPQDIMAALLRTPPPPVALGKPARPVRKQRKRKRR
jgi:hypothetical protein